MCFSSWPILLHAMDYPVTVGFPLFRFDLCRQPLVVAGRHPSPKWAALVKHAIILFGCFNLPKCEKGIDFCRWVRKRGGGRLDLLLWCWEPAVVVDSWHMCSLRVKSWGSYTTSVTEGNVFLSPPLLVEGGRSTEYIDETARPSAS